jgi:NAD(P)-dependent dehydrogenase (short-subunit alcohol dehydrogenase family)
MVLGTFEGNGKKIALVTGANRGIGFETCSQLAQQGYHVLLSARDETKGKEAVQKLQALGLEVEFLSMDVASDPSVEDAAVWVEKKFGKLDALVNNAGVFLDAGNDAASFLKADFEKIRASFEINTMGPLRTTRCFANLLEKSGQGRVVNVSSGMGQLAEMNGGCVGYRLSKTALNAVTRLTQDELKSKKIKVNSVCPGWVKTDMGGAGADREVSRGAETLVWLATLTAEGPEGGFFRDKKQIPW